MTRPPADLLAKRDAAIRVCTECDNRVWGDRPCGLCAVIWARIGRAS